MTRLHPPHLRPTTLLALVLWPIGATLATALLLAWLGPVALDGLPDNGADYVTAAALEDAQRAAARQARFDRAAQRVCGPQGAVQLLADGASVQCRDKHGRHTLTAQVQP